MIARLQAWVATNAVMLLSALLVVFITVAAVQTVRIDGFQARVLGHQLTLWKGLKTQVAECAQVRKTIKDEREARGREGKQGDKSFGDQSKACEANTRRARASGRMIEEVTHVEADPDGGPDGGLIGPERLRIILGQAPVLESQSGPVPVGSDSGEAQGADRSERGGSTQAEEPGSVRRALAVLFGRR